MHDRQRHAKCTEFADRRLADARIIRSDRGYNGSVGFDHRYSAAEHEPTNLKDIYDGHSRVAGEDRCQFAAAVRVEMNHDHEGNSNLIG